ncbi:MAG TPA: hypothetical protein DCZ94_07630 [Lentisphaeria bacterium]|nr:MAG: hypothetical protein A2X48_14310 [Lentisphaerae bacterium GWF2_49_21]HBC86807.1 hypothetical protein [Lentisphaeria bacterium]
MRFAKDIIRKMFSVSGYSIGRIQKPCNAEYFYLTKFLNYYLEKKGAFYFIQIGANDGVTFDPIREFIIRNPGKVKGILLEPMKEAYSKLVGNYKDFPDIIKENLAIHNTEKEMTLYKVDPAKRELLEKWSGGMASFNNEHHKLSNTPKEFILEEKVKCISLEELLLRHEVKKLDLLQIDTEGYDAEIIMNIDFSRIKPSIIRFEHGYMDKIMGKDKVEAILKLLNDNGYQIIIESYDATAYQPFLII